MPPAPTKRRAAAGRLPIPPLSSHTFGLVQERTAQEPFRLLVAVILLNQTHGDRALPVFDEVLGRYPKPADLATAAREELFRLLRPLGFGKRRMDRLIQLAHDWIAAPPTAGVVYLDRRYPQMPHLEIAHLGGLGPYAYDSWRIFCRDVLLGLADDWNGAGATKLGFEPEWKRVHPRDKELSAFVRWMWLKEGWHWDPDSGVRTAPWWASLGEAEVAAQPDFLRQLIEAATCGRDG